MLSHSFLSTHEAQTHTHALTHILCDGFCSKDRGASRWRGDTLRLSSFVSGWTENDRLAVSPSLCTGR